MQWRHQQEVEGQEEIWVFIPPTLSLFAIILVFWQGLGPSWLKLPSDNPSSVFSAQGALVNSILPFVPSGLGVGGNGFHCN